MKNENNILLYTTPKGNINISVRFENETFWLTQKAMAKLFGVEVPAISKHLKNIYSEKELTEDTTISKMETVVNRGFRGEVLEYIDFYSLDVVIAVGYRVNSKQATAFRIWATTTLKEFIIKGFVLDDERLKQGKTFGKDYFDELLQRIREIRASEKRFYQKIKDLFKLSDDYATTTTETEQFFAFVQNKLLYAVTQQTAAEIIINRADAQMLNMGLTTFKGSRVRKEDIFIAKNYLTEKEIDTLNRLVSLFLDTAELRIQNEEILTLDYWKIETDNLLTFSKKPILEGAGKISHKQMEAKVSKVYLDFDTNRKKIEAIAEDEMEQDAIKKLLNKAKKK
ncbi:MAG: RhuM family protein [Bacteroidota bacterium]